jgi:hypothetical protein
VEFGLLLVQKVLVYLYPSTKNIENMMTSFYSRKHQELMNRWKAKGLHINQEFIEDGIIDLNRWEATNRKVLVLLKEAYGGYGDLCSWIRDEWKGPKYKLWWTASYWLYALQKLSGKNIPPFPKEKGQFDECVDFLLSSAVVNIKKSKGETTSSAKDLEKYVMEDHDLLWEQIELIDPTIILCGYTFDQFRLIWRDNVLPVGKTDFIFRAGKYLVINWWHPANRYPDELCYYTLCAVLQESEIF